MNLEKLTDTWARLWTATPAELFQVLFHVPAISMTLGVALAVVLLRVGAGRRADAPPDAAGDRETVLLGAVASATALFWLVDLILRGYVVDMSSTVSWWRFAVAPATAALGFVVLLSSVRAAAPPRRLDAATASRRTWTTFGPRRRLPPLAVTLLTTIAIVILFGRSSTSLDPGVAAYIALEIPNTDAAPVLTSFPGWAYGVALLTSLIVLAALVWSALRRSALRPYPDGIPVERERERREAVARGIVDIALGATLMALAGLLRMARQSAVFSLTTTSPGTPTTVLDVALPHADLILVGGTLAPVLEIAGCTLLVLVAGRAALTARAPRERATAPARERS